MQFVPYEDVPQALRDKAFDLYVNSFPEHERRSALSHAAALKDSEFVAEVVVGSAHYDASDNIVRGVVSAIFFYWEHEQMIYIEHIAVNPELRGQNIGSRVLTQFIEHNRDKTIILEIDPLVDDVARRRMRFYSHLGFQQNDYHYIHPSYSVDGFHHNLVILSHGRTISQAEFDAFVDYMNTRVLKYID